MRFCQLIFILLENQLHYNALTTLIFIMMIKDENIFKTKLKVLDFIYGWYMYHFLLSHFNNHKFL